MKVAFLPIALAATVAWGRPVHDLRSGGFRVDVESRRVVSAELVAAAQDLDNRPPASDVGFTTNEPLFLRVATWSLPDEAPGMVKLLIGAEIGGQAEAQGLTVSYALLDASGKVAVSDSRAASEATGSEPIPYSTSATVAPGPYTLRLAARDGRGRLGSVDHPIQAGLTRVGTLAMSDLMLGPAPERGMAFRPAVVPEARGDTLHVHGEITGEKDALESASALLEVVSIDSGASLLTIPARVVRANGSRRRLLQGEIQLEGLAPGPYLARVVVAIGGMPRGAVVRPFHVLAP